MATVYDQHKDDDGFIYMAYSGENSMGSCWRDEYILHTGFK